MRGYNKEFFDDIISDYGPFVVEFYPISKKSKPKVTVCYIARRYDRYIVLPLDTRESSIEFRPRDVKYLMWLSTRVILPREKYNKKGEINGPLKKLNMCELDEYLQKHGYELY